MKRFQLEHSLAKLKIIREGKKTYTSLQQRFRLDSPVFIAAADRDVSPRSRQDPLNHRAAQFQTRQGRRPRAIQGDATKECADAQRQGRGLCQQRYQRCDWPRQKRHARRRGDMAGGLETNARVIVILGFGTHREPLG